jgi:hypothetical protein
METLSLHIVIALYRYCFGHMFNPLSLCTVIATGKLVTLSLLQVITFGILKQLSPLLVTALGILKSLSLLKVTL